MANYLHLGFNRRCYGSILALILPVTGFADFTTTDSQILSSIHQDLQTILQYNASLEDILFDLRNLQGDVADGNALLQTVDNDLYAINSTLQTQTTTLNTTLGNLSTTLHTDILGLSSDISTLDSHLSSGVSSLLTSLGHIQSAIPSLNTVHTRLSSISSSASSSLQLLGDILSTLQDTSSGLPGPQGIENRLDNIIYLLSSGSFGSSPSNVNATVVNPWISTNQLISIDPFFFGSEYLSSTTMLTYYRALTGKQNATAQEARAFWNLLSELGPYKWHFLESYLRLDYEQIPEDALEPYGILTAWFETSPFFTSMAYDYIDGIAKPYYYQYGVRPLIELVESFTNDAPYSGPFFHDTTVSGHTSKGFTQGFVNTVEGLSSSFSASITTNVADVSTNAIADVENATIVSQFADIRQGFESSKTLLQPVTESISSFESLFTESLEGGQSQDSFLLDFGQFSFNGSNVANLSITLSRPGETYFLLWRYALRFLSMCVILHYTLLVWRFCVDGSGLSS